MYLYLIIIIIIILFVFESTAIKSVSSYVSIWPLTHDVFGVAFHHSQKCLESLSLRAFIVSAARRRHRAFGGEKAASSATSVAAGVGARLESRCSSPPTE